MRRLCAVFEDQTMMEQEESVILPGYFGWDKLAEKDIIRLEFITDSVSIVLTLYNAYNVQPKVKNGRLEGMWLMGAKGDLVDVIHVDFLNEKIVRDQLDILNEELSADWKMGVVGVAGETYVIRLRRG